MADLEESGSPGPERVRAAEDLRDSEARLRSIIHNAPDLILRVDRDRRITFINRVPEGMRPESVIGTGLYEWAPPEARHVIESALETAFDTGVQQQYETQSVHPEGYRRWFAGRISPVLHDGQATGAIIISRDVTARKWVENLQARQNTFLRELAEGRPLDELLGRLARSVDDQLVGVMTAVAVLDDDGKLLRLVATPNLPGEVAAVLETTAPSRSATGLGLASYRNELVVIEDIETGIESDAVREPLRGRGVRSCWAQPIRSGHDRVLGELVVFCRVRRSPFASELELLEGAARLADIAIEQRRTERLMRRMNAAIERAMTGISCLDNEGRYLVVNKPYAAMTGYGPRELLGRTWEVTVHPDDLPVAQRAAAQLEREGQAEFQARALRKDGSVFHKHVFMLATEEADGFRGHYCFMRDVTEERKAQETRSRLEAQLRHSQKMEALGQLAGGVAHDFNNLLTAILGNAEVLKESLTRSASRAPGEADLALLEQIQRAGQRAAALTRQLLAFSRKQVRKLEVLDPNRAAESVEQILRRLIGENIQLQMRLASGVDRIYADASQIEQVIVNLSLNARDAMTSGGTLTIETSMTDLEAADVPAEARPGRYVKLTVRDTGTGMSADVQGHIFEPFFTTKPMGKGTGLGLSTVYGIVTQAEGFITVDSRPGSGTEFRVFLPAVSEPASKAETAPPLPEVRGEETVLVCEDEDQVRLLACEFLKSVGYRVLAAENGRRAIELLEDLGGPIDLLVTDAVMPEMNGRELAESLQRRQPDLPVLFVSGYPDDVIASQGVDERSVEFLEKPFGRTSLLRRVREVLDGARDPG